MCMYITVNVPPLLTCPTYIYIYVYTCVYIYIHVCIYMYVWSQVHTHTMYCTYVRYCLVFVSAHVGLHVCGACVCVCMCVCVLYIVCGGVGVCLKTVLLTCVLHVFLIGLRLIVHAKGFGLP